MTKPNGGLVKREHLTFQERRHLKEVDSLRDLMLLTTEQSDQKYKDHVSFAVNTVVNLLHPNPDKKEYSQVAAVLVKEVAENLSEIAKDWAKENHV